MIKQIADPKIFPAAKPFQLARPAGFTLIELLVVILIIGILSAVALPQYRKAVEKSRLSKALTMVAAAEKEADLYILKSGYPPEKVQHLFGPDAVSEADLSAGLECSDENVCYSKNFEYRGYCSFKFCEIIALPHEVTYVLAASRNAGRNWYRYCQYSDEESRALCDNLSKQGWDPVSNDSWYTP